VSIALCDHPDIVPILERLVAMGYGISPASLRLDDLTEPIVALLPGTVAPNAAAAAVASNTLTPRLSPPRLPPYASSDRCLALRDRNERTRPMRPMVRRRDLVFLLMLLVAMFGLSEGITLRMRMTKRIPHEHPTPQGP
jgi:hypothetical protein